MLRGCVCGQWWTPFFCGSGPLRGASFIIWCQKREREKRERERERERERGGTGQKMADPNYSPHPQETAKEETFWVTERGVVKERYNNGPTLINSIFFPLTNCRNCLFSRICRNPSLFPTELTQSISVNRYRKGLVGWCDWRACVSTRRWFCGAKIPRFSDKSARISFSFEKTFLGFKRRANGWTIFGGERERRKTNTRAKFSSKQIFCRTIILGRECLFVKRSCCCVYCTTFTSSVAPITSLSLFREQVSNDAIYALLRCKLLGRVLDDEWRSAFYPIIYKSRDINTGRPPIHPKVFFFFMGICTNVDINQWVYLV